MTARQTDSEAAGKAKAAATREAKGSVQEAIGKLIGDDAVQKQGAAEKQAGADAAAGSTGSSTSSRSSRP